ncbi:nucleoplasmin-2b [Alosa pseudoharengus]|uniref:nucleoplasmin-2b n=1 Tax=Alosa pseudoharengus TaxID=34774 RepID=UPI003F8C166B
MNKSDKPLSTLWGCELTEANKEKTFSTEETNLQHQLAVRSMCLGHTAKEEFNIIELVTGSGKNATEGIPIATLHAKSMPTVILSGVDLHPPVTFRLKFGSGPVHICAEHVAFEEDLSDEEMAEEEEEEDEVEDEEDIEESPEKPVKKAAKNGGPVKYSSSPSVDLGSTLSDDENNPPKKGKGRGRKPAQKV